MRLQLQLMLVCCCCCCLHCRGDCLSPCCRWRWRACCCHLQLHMHVGLTPKEVKGALQAGHKWAKGSKTSSFFISCSKQQGQAISCKFDSNKQTKATNSIAVTIETGTTPSAVTPFMKVRGRAFLVACRLQNCNELLQRSSCVHAVALHSWGCAILQHLARLCMPRKLQSCSRYCTQLARAIAADRLSLLSQHAASA